MNSLLQRVFPLLGLLLIIYGTGSQCIANTNLPTNHKPPLSAHSCGAIDFTKLKDKGNRVYVLHSDVCPDCVGFKPTLAVLINKFPDIKFIEMNVDKNKELFEVFKTDTVPNLFLVSEDNQCYLSIIVEKGLAKVKEGVEHKEWSFTPGEPLPPEIIPATAPDEELVKGIEITLNIFKQWAAAPDRSLWMK